MFCPKCGSESVEAQRFCKACGTNLQLINDALSGGDGPQGPFGINVDELAKNARDFAKSWKTNVAVAVGGRTGSGDARERHRVSREIRKQAREEARRQNLPKPKEYMSYSWQHNLRNGLVSLFWGAGLGVLLYYLGQTAIDEGLIRRLEESSQGHVQGLEPIVRMIWMIALLPVLKGLAHIIYAAFFAESMAMLAARFTPPPLLEEPQPFIRQDTAPVVERQSVPIGYEPPIEPPPSVTEHTTHIFDESQPQMKREPQ
ncbi:MAG: zinc ribbon domain-containing protein [Acidobacteriota bacterium]